MFASWDIADVEKITYPVMDKFIVPIAFIRTRPERVPQETLFTRDNVFQNFGFPIVRVEGGVVYFQVVCGSPARFVVYLVDLVYRHGRLPNQ
jgi:hypothetical protein